MSITENWLIPCNINKFNLIEHFEKNSLVVWKNSFSMHKGDYAYIYLGKPYCEIRYKCKVVSDDVSEELLRENEYARVEQLNNNYFSKKIKYVQLELLNVIKPGSLPYGDLKKNGLGQVQIQARVDAKLLAFINERE